MFNILLADEVAKGIQEHPDPAFARFILGLVMVFHVERIRGKSPAQAQAVVDKLSANLENRLRTERLKQETSLEKPPEQHPQDDPQHQKA